MQLQQEKDTLEEKLKQAQDEINVTVEALVWAGRALCAWCAYCVWPTHRNPRTFRVVIRRKSVSLIKRCLAKICFILAVVNLFVRANVIITLNYLLIPFVVKTLMRLAVCFGQLICSGFCLLSGLFSVS